MVFSRHWLLLLVSLGMLLLVNVSWVAGKDVNEQTCSNPYNDEDHTCGLPTINSDCQDSHEKCPDWARIGECENNPTYMNTFCQSSCNSCEEEVPQELSDQEDDGFSGLEIDKASIVMGEGQVLDGMELGVERSQILEIIQNAMEYRKTVPKRLHDLCVNKHPLCAIWVAIGECEANPPYMETHCSPVCQTCDRLTIEDRCPLDPNAPQAWGPGDLDLMFQKLTNEPYLSQHDVQTLSSPSTNGPWVITMENVITEEEATRIFELGTISGYKQSTEVFAPGPDGKLAEQVSDHRTSFNTWCQNNCYEDEIAQRVIHRLSDLTGINETNSEYLQLLRYTENQYYLPHHDYIHTDVSRQQGPRILTVFLYLNDVEEGGETEFTSLQLQVKPKMGRALLWPSVLNDDPLVMDARTYHQALKVRRGIKYGANAWFHLRDFKTPNRIGCQG